MPVNVFIVYAALLLVFAAVISLVSPQFALAKSYECSRVDIVAQAETNADLHVVEQRTFDYEGSFSAVWWNFFDLPSSESLVVHGIRMAQVDEQGNVVGEWVELEEVPFEEPWRFEGGPDGSAYSYDAPMNTVYAFFDWSDTSVVFELDYTIVGAIRAYEDVAEVSWRYLPSDWEVASENVTASIVLPVPAGEVVAPELNVFAWGHGPADGEVKIGLDGAVEYQVPVVPAGQFSEARVLFPVTWLTNAGPEILDAHEGDLLLGDAQCQEKVWADTAVTKQVNRFKILAGATFVLAFLLLVAVAAFVLCGRDRKPDFRLKYLREIPEELHGLHPAVVGRLWRWNRPSADDFVASVLHLVRVGAVRVSEGSYEGPNGESVQDCCLTVVEDVACECVDPIDRATLNMLFGHFGKRRKALWSGSIRAFAQEDPREFASLMKDWQRVVTLRTLKEELFDLRSFNLQRLFVCVALLALAFGVCVAVSMGEYEPALLGVVAFAGIGLIANYMPRRTQRGANLVARCKALRNWLSESGLAVDDEMVAEGEPEPERAMRVDNQMRVLAYVLELAEDKTAARFSAALESAARSADAELAKRTSAYNGED